MTHSAARGYWTHEDGLAYYRIVPGADLLKVFDQGVFARDFRSWQLGIGGMVVSKQPLGSGFAGNEVSESACPIWLRIRNVIETLVLRELTTAKRLTDAQKKYLGIRFRSLAEWAEPRLWKGVKLLTDPSGGHLPLSALARYTRFVHIPEPDSLDCAVHGTDGTFVVTDALLDRFGVDSLREWLGLLCEAGLLSRGYSVIEAGGTPIRTRLHAGTPGVSPVTH